MVRTTPPRPIDVTKDFPELAAMARTALRLHPRAGAPTVEQSSVGGPLLWPVDEPWPVCEAPHSYAKNASSQTGAGDAFTQRHTAVSPTTVRLRRRLLQQAWDRGHDAQEQLLNQDELELMSAALDADLEQIIDDPTPMVPIVQLYLREAHGAVAGPEGADLLQILWCPFDHDPHYLPTSRIRWRRSSDGVDRALVQPEPTLIQSEYYFPDPCVIHPEPVTEYPASDLMPEGLCDQIFEQEEAWSDVVDFQNYQYDLSMAPGWKIGGWAPWSFSDATPALCPACGSEQQPFLYVDSCEWDGGNGSWKPLEDRSPDAWPHRYPSANNQVQVTIGRGYGMQIYTCPVSYDHPSVEFMQ